MRSTFIFVIFLAFAINYTWTQGLQGYPCNVPNCQLCSYIGFCGLCNPNYILQLNYTNSQSYCQKLSCNITDCAYCYQNDVCAYCKNGFYLNTVGQCINGTQLLICSPGCIACNSSSCAICQYGYQIKDGVCQKVNGNLIQNCQAALSAVACQLCQPYYIVAPSYKCIQVISCPIPNCLLCGQGLFYGQYTCNVCQPGFTPDYDTQVTLFSLSCVPNQCKIDFCIQCQSYNQCLYCLDGYMVNQNYTCSLILLPPCPIQNCISCQNSLRCQTCQSGYGLQCSGPFSNDPCICSKLISSKGGVIQVTNCLEYDYIIPGVSDLFVGCVNCQPNFINVGGYCVGNLTITAFQCNIKNCLYCVQNNVCGQCIPGYTVYFGAVNFCFKNYSPVFKCQLAPIGLFYNYYSDTFINYCFKCSQGYLQLNYFPYCIQNNIRNCNISNCSYCIENSICSSCLYGFTLVNNTCNFIPPPPLICTIENCNFCENNITCGQCISGFYLFNNTCLNGSTYQNLSYCISRFGQSCANCSYFSCLNCVQGYSFSKYQNQRCCPSPVQNILNCNKYSIQWSKYNCSAYVVCTQCNKGSILFLNKQLCISLPCTIDNCLYCFGSNTCSICDENYTLLNGDCIPYQTSACPSNCVECNNQSICIECLNGYSLYNGICICSIQNCLQCMGDSFCTICAFPTIPTYGSSSCLPPASPILSCSVQNCQNCLTISSCAVCSYGFTLQINGSCQKNPCRPENNCSLCNQDQSLCYLCNDGYIPESYLSASCIPLGSNYSCEINGCIFCSNPKLCQACSPYFYLNSNGTCQAFICLNNCVTCLSNSSCLLCENGFYLTNNNTCLLSPQLNQDAPCHTGNNSIFGCVICSKVNSSVCILCQWGFLPSTDGLTCIPQICSVPNCQICLQNETFNNGFPLCLVCKQGYLISQNFQCIPYPQVNILIPDCSNSYNCLFCSYDNYCELCPQSWNAINGVCVTTYGCSIQNCQSCSNPKVCNSCYENYQLIDNICVVTCVSNCLTCSSSNTCALCLNNFQLISNGTLCQCPISNGFVLLNNSCICPNQFTQYESNCYLCSTPFCLLCSSENYCYTCQPSFFNNNGTCKCNFPLILTNSSCQCPQGQTYFNNSCLSCNIENCFLCQLDDICSICNGDLILQNGGLNCGCNSTTSIQNGIFCICQAGYYFDTTSSTCLQCNIDNCLFCGQGSYGLSCLQCIGNLVASDEGNKCSCQFNLVQYNEFCYLCNIFNCQTCSSDNVCLNCFNNLTLIGDQCLCINGYFLNVYNQQCFVCNLQGCQTCVSLGTSGMCSKCLTGYFLNNGVCILCTYPCSICNSTQSCLVCQFPFSMTPAENGTCFTCSIPFCTSCNPSNTSQCIQCIQRYSLNSGNCIYSSACSIHCTNCQKNIVCLSCGNGYTVNESNPGQCLACSIVNCATCQSSDLNTCLSCLPGYYIGLNGACFSCPFSICQTCNQTQCLTFQPSTGFFALEANNTISPFTCDSSCQNCSLVNPSICLNCYLGYSLSANGTCAPCTYPCLTCLPGSPSACQSCYGNLILVNNTICQTCPQSSNCLTCFNNASICSSCPNGFYLNDGACSPGCPPNCLSCSSNTTCSQCLPGFSLNPFGFCLPCTSNCRLCSGTIQGVCLQCGQGFYLSSTNNSQLCTICPQFCLKCSQLGCSNCLSGYYLSPTFTCIPTCNYPCATCSLEKPNSCISCIFGYLIQSSTLTCVPNVQCSITKSCQYCPQGFALYQSVCVQCPNGLNCSRCDPLSNNTCLSCLNGYYLNTNSTCSSCPFGCETCSSISNCLSCNPGYTLPIQPISSPGVCSQCLFPCNQCFGATTTCTSCVEGYSLNGWNCQSKFNFGFFISLDTVKATFYQNYALFLNSIVGSSVNYPNITILRIQTGSVNVTGNISTSAQSGSNTAVNQYNTYKSIISGPSIAGMKIIASSLTVNGGFLPPSPQPEPFPPTPTPSNNSNLAIILGICIPISLIIIGAIIYLMVKQFCIKKVPQSQYGQNTTVRQQFEMGSI